MTNAEAGAPFLLRSSKWDAVLVFLAIVHGGLVLSCPTLPVIALGLWWSSNTVAHYFIHQPFFKPRWLNGLFSLYLSLLLGVPQTLWRERHLAHHAGCPWRFKLSGPLILESLVVLSLWTALLALAPRIFFAAYLPGYCAGLGLCALHGHQEHALGTASHYGLAYNLLFFNDGYHVEHHLSPGLHWTRLRSRPQPGARASRWPAVLRWMELFSLESLERFALRWKPIQRLMIASHEKAFRGLLPRGFQASRVAIVGGGLFPRTALILRRFFPGAHIVIIDSSAESIEKARHVLEGDVPGGAPDGAVEFVHAAYDPGRHAGFDLVVVPLSFRGDRAAIYRRPAAPMVFVHDWIWRRKGASVVVSSFLLKRLNLVRG
jgi:hypothetical protein